ncbi:MAG: MarR family transcriptional regulator [bacterium]|nr:MarR family transcriptional regulator [bacterium]
MNIDRHLNASPEEMTFRALMMTWRSLFYMMETTLQEIDMSGPRMWTLRLLEDAESPLTMSQLAERTASVKSNVTQLIDRMESEHLVRRVRNPDDRRSVFIEVTDLGRERLAAAETIAQSDIRQVFGKLKPFELEQMRDYLERLRGGVVECEAVWHQRHQVEPDKQE